MYYIIKNNSTSMIILEKNYFDDVTDRQLWRTSCRNREDLDVNINRILSWEHDFEMGFPPNRKMIILKITAFLSVIRLSAETMSNVQEPNEKRLEVILKKYKHLFSSRLNLGMPKSSLYALLCILQTRRLPNSRSQVILPTLMIITSKWS